MSKYEKKEMIDQFIYKTYNLLADFSFMFSNDRRLVKRNSIFKNIHQNSRCYILGTGPSLKNIDLSLLKNEALFGVNFLHKSNFINDIDLKYYCIYDEWFYTDGLEYTINLIKELPETIFFVRSKAYDVLKKNKVVNSNIYFQSCRLFQHGNFIKTDMRRNITAPYNVVVGCIQTAIYMGFKEIYLLGCDFDSFASLKVKHCYLEDNKERTISLGEELKYYSLVAYHHYAINSFAKRNNISIINLTESSLLDAYQKKEFSVHIDSKLELLKG